MIEVVFCMGLALSRHGVIENGKNGVLSAMKELEEIDAIGIDMGRIRAKDGIQFEGEFKYLENYCFHAGCVMLLAGAASICGVGGEMMRKSRQLCATTADRIAMTVNPDTREVVWNTLSAGLCVLANAHREFGDEDVAIRLGVYSLKYNLTPDGRRRWEELLLQSFLSNLGRSDHK
jgi:hypothetical protein